MNIPVPDPETIALLQSFGYGIAQNLIASAIVEWKKLKDDRGAQESVTWLAKAEHAKPLENRIGQSVCEALRNLNLTKKQFELLLPLASDPILGGELVRQILADRYSPEAVTALIIKSSPSSESIHNELIHVASRLTGAI